MHPLETESTGNLTPAELARFGGTYTFREKLQLGGTGSSKIIYQEGIPTFDELRRGIQNEVAYANFEWLKNGLILRLNINQRLSCVGLTLEENGKHQLSGSPHQNSPDALGAVSE